MDLSLYLRQLDSVVVFIPVYSKYNLLNICLSSIFYPQVTEILRGWKVWDHRNVITEILEVSNFHLFFAETWWGVFWDYT